MDYVVNLNFNKLKVESNNIEFGSTAAVYNVNFNVVLKPAVNVIISNIDNVSFNVVLKPRSNFELTRYNQYRFNVVLKPSTNVILSRIDDIHSNIVLKPSTNTVLSRIDGIHSNIILKPSSNSVLSRIDKTTINVSLNKPQSFTTVQYDNNVWRGLVSNNDFVYNKGLELNIDNKVVWNYSIKLDKQYINVYNKGLELQTNIDIDYSKLKVSDTITNSNYSNGLPLNNNTESSYNKLIQNDVIKSGSYSIGKPVNISVESSYIRLFKNDKNTISKFNKGIKLDKDLLSDYGKGLSVNKSYIVPWSRGKLLVGYSRPKTVIPIDPVELYSNDINFIDRCIITNHIDFGKIIKRTKKIIKRKFYYMLHDISVVRRLDAKPIKISKIDISTNRESWGWTVNLTVLGKKSAQLLKDFTPMEILISINGYQWVFVINEIRENYSFSNDSFSASGYSQGIYLSEQYKNPLNEIESQDRTIQQLMNNLLPNDFTEIDFQSNYNWLVDGGIFDYTNKTPIENIMELSRISGNFLYSSRTEKEFSVIPNYKVSPWDLHYTNPDIEIPLSVIFKNNITYKKGNNYNRVYVVGDKSNVLGDVKIYGTAGDIMPDNVLSSSLITHVDGARAYGRDYLINNLDKFIHNLEMPLTDKVPLIDLGTLIQLQESTPFKAFSSDLVVSVSVSDRMIEVKQKLNVEKFI